MKSRNINYGFIVYQIETTNGIQWCVEYPDVAAVVGGGDTVEEAIADAKENLNIYLDYLEKQKLPLPTSSTHNNDYSGKVTLRMSYSLHKRVAELSDRNGVSINSYINDAIREKTIEDIYNESIDEAINKNKNLIKKKLISSIK